MEENKIIAILTARNYPDKAAKLVAKEILKLSDPLSGYFSDWADDGQCQHDFECEGYSIAKLQKERGMSYPAALLTMDWIIKEPECAIKSLRKGTR